MTTHPPGTLIANRFELRAVLGQGGMATVYAARDRHLRHDVAVKVLSTEVLGQPTAIERFLQEARAVVRLRSEHVVRVIDVGTLPSGAPYLVMEFLEGKSLRAHLAERKRLSVNEVVDCVLQVLEALAEAHRAGIVHRDLKPDNLMLLLGEDGAPLIKVIDFGISKLIGPEFTVKNLTVGSSFLGSPLYASPEQLRDSAKVDCRADIWSLGILMYELLAGRPPFDARSAPELLYAICHAEPAPLGELEPNIPPSLVRTVERCLAKLPEQRFSNVQELAQALAPLAPSLSRRLSVDRILRMDANSQPVRGIRASSVPPPAWSSATMPPAPPELGTTARHSRRLRALAAIATSAGVLAGLSVRARPVTPRPTAAAPSNELAQLARAPAARASELVEMTAAPPVDAGGRSSEAMAPAAISSPSHRAKWASVPVAVRDTAAKSGSARPATIVASAVPSAAPSAAAGPRVRSLDQDNPFAHE